MLFGKENSMPLNIVYGRVVNVAPCESNCLEWLIDSLSYTYEKARRRMATKLCVQKAYYVRRIKSRTFAVWDQVIWLRPRVKKLENVWQGLYIVKNRLLERNYYTIEKDGLSRRATAEQLRAYNSSEATTLESAREILNEVDITSEADIPAKTM